MQLKQGIQNETKPVNDQNLKRETISQPFSKKGNNTYYVQVGMKEKEMK